MNEFQNDVLDQQIVKIEELEQKIAPGGGGPIKIHPTTIVWGDIP